MRKFQQHRGFSILMALGIIAILMIVVTDLAGMYMRELKLSRLSYDEILANASAQGAFEYAMLKVKNHEDGFQDNFTSEGNDKENFFKLSTPRSENLNVEYEILAQSRGATFSIPGNSSIVIPLFVGDDEKNFQNSKKPTVNAKIEITKGLTVKVKNASESNLSWNISARNAILTDIFNTNYLLYGEGEITGAKEGKIQFKTVKCSYVDGAGNVVSEEGKNCDEEPFFTNFNATDEEKRERLIYDYTRSAKVRNFVENTDIPTNPLDMPGYQKTEQSYLILKNSSANELEVEVSSDTPFALPKRKITAIAKKNDAVQKFEFLEDKTEWYQFLLNAY